MLARQTAYPVAYAELRRRAARKSLICFIQQVAPWFTIEEIHVAIAAHLEAVAEGRVDRLMIFMPPRAGKSRTVSVFFAAWWRGLYPSDEIMQVCYAISLAEEHSDNVRALMRLPEYRAIFPEISVSRATASKKRWRVDAIVSEDGTADETAGYREGQYAASGTTGGIAGKGFNLGIIDDPMSEQDKNSDGAIRRVNGWYGPGFYTRRQPERNAIVVMMTRWRKDDLAGYLLEQAKNGGEFADKWVVLQIPAVLTREAAETLNRFTAANDNFPGLKLIRLEEGDSFSPRRWTKAELERSRANMTERDWNALYLQNPTQEEGVILKRKFWRKWPDKEPPFVEVIYQFYDTAFEDGEENDYSARTTWGIFLHSDTGEKEDMRYHAILLEGWQERVPAADLKAEAKKAWWGDRARKSADVMRPDRIYIERRASGHQLIQELRRARLPARPWLPPKGSRHNKGKVPLAHVASIPLQLGSVWYMDRKFAQEVIGQCADFPFGEHDDWANTVIMALVEFRRRFLLQVEDDEPDDEEKEEMELNRPPARTRRLYG
ncbi:MAG: hypothetical protein KF895_03025 [Parvibaculum sp.]|nr:hypothetical protein [Parvibaculum sp.]